MRWSPFSITNPVLNSDIRSEVGARVFKNFVSGLVGLSLVIGIIIFSFILVIAAIQWITAGGDKVAIESAKSKLLNALVGIIILLAVFAILSFIQNFFGVDILAINLSSLKIDTFTGSTPVPTLGPGEIP
jgi:hypothetical protein